ncbi:MAG: aminopeptidase P family protein, partial [Pyrinomonadaceae bacterium]
ELEKRRQAVMMAMTKTNPNSVMILFSAEPRLYTNDVDYVFRQENNLYYLTMLKKAGATLVLIPGNRETPEILFLPKRDPRNETWNGKMYSREEASLVSGVKTVFDAEDFTPFIAALRAGKAFEKVKGMTTIYQSAPTPAKLYLLQPVGSDGREWAQEIAFADTWKNQANFKVENAQFIFWDLRLIKSPFEIKILQHAIDITTEAFGRSMAVAGRSKMEYEVQAEVEYTFRRRNADFWGYPSIVGCGPNATTLHYEESQGAVKPGDLLLMDVGAEYDHYTADVTRTFPINGKFSKEQAEVYQIVYDAQEAVARATKPGANFQDVNAAAVKVINDGLFKLGLITDKNSKQYRIWFMHGTSHWLGMNVHDVGASNNRFKPGNVFTNEPGIYIREDALLNLQKTPENEKFIAAVRPAFEKYKNIGVRIEDDLLVTETGCEWLTKNLPRTIDDIENMIAGAKQELPANEDSFLIKPKMPNLLDERGFNF